MICTACGRQDAMAVFLGGSNLTGGACPECVALADAMQDLWSAVRGDPTPFAAAVGHVMRVTIERNVPELEWGWRCEDCAFATGDEQAALDHSDERKHSLARAPL